MHWANTYLRIPFKEGGRGWDGCDCWGMVVLPWKEENGVDVPVHSGVMSGDPEDRTALESELGSGMWNEIPLAEAAPFDVVLFERGPKFHCGLVVEPGMMLHIRRDHPHGKIEQIEQPHYMRMFKGVWRYDG